MLTHIFVVGSCYPAELGGPSNTIFNMAKALQENGHKVLILSTMKGIQEKHIQQYSIKANKKTLIEGVPIIFFSYSLSHVFCLRMLIFTLGLSKQKHALHLNSVLYLQSFFIAFIASCKRIKFSIAPRGELLSPALSSKSFKKTIYNYCINFILKKASRVIATSVEEKQSVINQISSINSAKVTILHNYIDMPIYNEADITLNRHSVVYLGRLNPHKCIENLITAYSQLDKQLQAQYSLIIAGQGEKKYVTELKALSTSLGMNSYINFAGHVTGEAKIQLLRECELFVLPSKSENFGNVVVESLSQGAPALVSLGAPWSVLPAVQAGFHESNSVSSLRQCISGYLCLESSVKVSYRRNAFALYNEKFSLSKNTLQIINALSFRVQ